MLPVIGHPLPAIGHLLPVIGHLLPVIGHLLPVIGHLLPVIGHLLPVVGHLLPVVGHLLPVVGHLLPVIGHSPISSRLPVLWRDIGLPESVWVPSWSISVWPVSVGPGLTSGTMIVSRRFLVLLGVSSCAPQSVVPAAIEFVGRGVADRRSPRLPSPYRGIADRRSPRLPSPYRGIADRRSPGLPSPYRGIADRRSPRLPSPYQGIADRRSPRPSLAWMRPQVLHGSCAGSSVPNYTGRSDSNDLTPVRSAPI